MISTQSITCYLSGGEASGGEAVTLCALRIAPDSPIDNSPADDSPSLPAAAVILCHGALGGKAQFVEMAHYLAAAGFIVWVPDMPGHGDSGGARHHVSIVDWQAALTAWLAQISQDPQVDAKRIGALGFSSGGTAVLEYAIQGQGLSAIVTLDATVRSVLSKGEEHLLNFLCRLGRWKRRWTGSDLHLPLYPIARASRAAFDDSVNKAVFADPEVRNGYWHYPLPGGAESFVVSTLTRVSRIKVPTCVLHGAEDAIDPVETAYALFEQLAGEKALHLIPRCGHMAHLDPGRALIHQHACDWFLRYLERRRPVYDRSPD